MKGGVVDVDDTKLRLPFRYDPEKELLSKAVFAHTENGVFTDAGQ